MTIDRPRRRNALDEATIAALRAALRDAADDPARKAVVLTGEGTQSFCAGSDLKAAAEMTQAEQIAHTAHGQLLMEELEDHPCLVVAAVEGWCLGGGFELALACDVRVAGAGTTFGLPEVTLGMIPGWGGTYRLSRVAGLGLAKAVALGGLRLDADAAVRAGIAIRAVPEGEAYEAAIALATEATEKATREGFARAKTLLTLGARVDNRTGRQLELLTETILTGSAGYGSR